MARLASIAPSGGPLLPGKPDAGGAVAPKRTAAGGRADIHRARQANHQGQQHTDPTTLEHTPPRHCGLRLRREQPPSKAVTLETRDENRNAGNREVTANASPAVRLLHEIVTHAIRVMVVQ